MKAGGKWWVAVVLVLAAHTLAAQSNGWTVSVSGGWMTPNNFNMPEYSAGTFGLEAAWWHRFEGDEWWMKRRKHPEFGLRGSVAFIPSGMSGHRIGAVGYIQAPLWGRLDYHWGVGLSAYTRSAYFTHDTANIFITTLLCCLIDGGVDWNIGQGLSASLSFLHSSSGMLNYPNKGLNYLQLALAYRLSGQQRREVPDLSASVPPFFRHEFGVTLSPALAKSRIGWARPVLMPCYDVSLNYQYYTSPAVAFGGTVDFWFNGHHWSHIRSGELDWHLPVYVSALASIEGFWGPVSLKGGIGPVLLASEAVGVRFYERVGAYYNWGNQYVGVAINAHAGMAEFIEWSYGVRLHRR